MHVNSVVALGSVLYDSALVCCLNFRQHIEATLSEGKHMTHLNRFGVYIMNTDTWVYVMDDFGTLVPLENVASNYFYRFS